MIHSEIGFEHSAFIFSYESMMSDTKVAKEKVEPGPSYRSCERQLAYAELEAHMRDVRMRKETHS